MTITELKQKLIAQGAQLPGVYKITRNRDGRVYIGQTEKPIIDRIIQHINNVRVNKASDSIDRAIQQEGFEAFTYEVEVFLPHADTDQLWDLESQYINKYDSYNNGFNLTKGNHVGKSVKNTASYIMHTVKVDVFKKYIARPFNLDFNKKKVLLVNYFGPKVLGHLNYEDCEYTIISSSAYVEFNTKGDLVVKSKEYGEYIMAELEKLHGKHFDIIISNPPYGKTGANITKDIVDNIDYDEFINLLPANDYKRNDDKDLFKYVDMSTMKPVEKGFEDAAVTTHVAKITKKPCMYITLADFEIENYIDPSLKKYFYGTRDRQYGAFENNDQGNHPERWSNTKTVIMGFKDSANGHMPYTKDCNTYKWNVEKSIDSDWIIANCNYYAKSGRGLRVPFVGFTFDTEVEHDNFVKFFYSDKGFKFMSKVITALNADSWVGTEKYMPKVDWTREWTVEEVLADYGYTQDEIKEVVDSLDNFRGMDN